MSECKLIHVVGSDVSDIKRQNGAETTSRRGAPCTDDGEWFSIKHSTEQMLERRPQRARASNHVWYDVSGRSEDACWLENSDDDEWFGVYELLDVTCHADSNEWLDITDVREKSRILCGVNNDWCDIECRNRRTVSWNDGEWLDVRKQLGKVPKMRLLYVDDNEWSFEGSPSSLCDSSWLECQVKEGLRPGLWPSYMNDNECLNVKYQMGTGQMENWEMILRNFGGPGSAVTNCLPLCIISTYLDMINPKLWRLAGPGPMRCLALASFFCRTTS